MINLSLEELKIVAKLRKLKDYKSKSEDELIIILSKTKPKIEEITKKFNELRGKFSKIKEIRRSLYEIFLHQKEKRLKKMFLS